MPENLSVAYMETAGINSLEGIECVELMGEVIEFAERERPGCTATPLWIEPASGAMMPLGSPEYWNFHCVPLIDGLVHCAWHPSFVLPPKDYAAAAFPGQRVTMEVLDTSDEHPDGETANV